MEQKKRFKRIYALGFVVSGKKIGQVVAFSKSEFSKMNISETNTGPFLTPEMNKLMKRKRPR